MRLRIPALALTAISVLAQAACTASDRRPLPSGPAAGVPLAEVAGGRPLFLECADVPRTTTSGTLSIFGGAVSHGRATIALPFGAVLQPTTLTVSVPESPYGEVVIRANGAEHFQFLQTAVVTMSYAGCGVDPSDPPMSVWYVDEATKAPIAKMPSLDSRSTQTVTFITNHLTGYIFSNRSDTTSTGDGQ